MTIRCPWVVHSSLCVFGTCKAYHYNIKYLVPFREVRTPPPDKKSWLRACPVLCITVITRVTKGRASATELGDLIFSPISRWRTVTAYLLFVKSYHGAIAHSRNSRGDWVCPPKTIPESNAKMLIPLLYVLKHCFLGSF